MGFVIEYYTYMSLGIDSDQVNFTLGMIHAVYKEYTVFVDVILSEHGDCGGNPPRSRTSGCLALLRIEVRSSKLEVLICAEVTPNESG